jgi:hypothetical protein
LSCIVRLFGTMQQANRSRTRRRSPIERESGGPSSSVPVSPGSSWGEPASRGSAQFWRASRSFWSDSSVRRPARSAEPAAASTAGTTLCRLGDRARGHGRRCRGLLCRRVHRLSGRRHSRCPDCARPEGLRRAFHRFDTVVVGVFVATIGFADDWAVGPIVIALAAVLPALVTFAVTAAVYGLVQYAACRWLLRRRDEWLEAHGRQCHLLVVRRRRRGTAGERRAAASPPGNPVARPAAGRSGNQPPTTVGRNSAVSTLGPWRTYASEE